MLRYALVCAPTLDTNQPKWLQPRHFVLVTSRGHVITQHTQARALLEIRLTIRRCR